MLSWLIRLVLLVGAMACLTDAMLPLATQQSQIVGHARTITATTNNRAPVQRSTDYKLGLTGGPINSCSVDSAAYEVLHDGDTVTVKTSRLFKSCVKVEHEDDQVYGSKYWRLFRFLFAAVLIVFFFASFFANQGAQGGGTDFDDGPSYNRSYTIVDSDSSNVDTN